MTDKPRTAAELAVSKEEKKTYSLSLLVSQMDALSEIVDNQNNSHPKKRVALSHLVDEAIRSYLATYPPEGFKGSFEK